MLKNEEGIKNTLPFINNPWSLPEYIPINEQDLENIGLVSQSYPFKISRYYLGLIDKEDPACPIRRQVIPSIEELSGKGIPDPLMEREVTKTPILLQRYRGRGVMLTHADCAAYCRFCNRKRFVGKGENLKQHWDDTLGYIEKNGEIKEIIVSGGDPFMLAAGEFSYILDRLRRIDTIKVIRVSTRIPLVHPHGLKKGHLNALKKAAPIWVVIHINHPREMSEGFIEAAKRIRENGAVMVSQTVLLRGVNDCPHILKRLFEGLLCHGVKPYYLFQLDEVRGAMHFKVSLERGIEIMRVLRRDASGLAIPHFAVDLPGGKGKVPIEYPYIKKRQGKTVYISNADGEECMYRDDGKATVCADCKLRLF